MPQPGLRDQAANPNEKVKAFDGSSTVQAAKDRVKKAGRMNPFTAVAEQEQAGTGFADQGPLHALQNLLKGRYQNKMNESQVAQSWIPTPNLPGGSHSYALASSNGQYENARIPLSALTAIGGGHHLRNDAAGGYNGLLAAAQAAGINVGLESSYRDYDHQASLYQQYLNGTGNLAAKPGHSNHGLGLSLDFGVSSNPALLNWLKQNAGTYGFVNDVPSENWHYTFKGT